MSADGNEQVRQSIADTRALLDQQEYEFQKAVADLQLAVRELELAASSDAQIELDLATEICSMPTNLKHALRDARHELQEAVRYVQGVVTTVARRAS